MRVGARVQKGDLILSCSPFVFVLDEDVKGEYCDHCALRAPLTPCSGCGVDHFCSASCREEAAPVHQHECPLLRKRTSDSSLHSFVRLMVKTLVRLKHGGDEERVQVDDKLSISFRHLDTKAKEIRQDEEHYQGFLDVCEELEVFFGAGYLPGKEQLLQLIMNTCSLRLDGSYSYGRALYLGAAPFRHSCLPTAEVAFRGAVMTLRAVVGMESYHSDKVLVCHTRPLQPAWLRRQQLHDNLFVDCRCEACSDEAREALENTINCGNLNCTYPVEVPPPPLSSPAEEPLTVSLPSDTPALPYLSCPRCGYNRYPPTLMGEYRDTIQRCEDTLQEYYSEDSDESSYQLMECQVQHLERRQCKDEGGQKRSLLHPLNVYRVRHLEAAQQAALEVGHLELALRFGEQNLQGMRHYHGPNSAAVGMCLLQLGKTCAFLKRCKKALHYFKEAERVLTITHGGDHPLLQDELRPFMDQLRLLKQAMKDPLSLRHYRKCEQKWGLREKKKINWLYWTFAGVILGITYLGIHG